MSRLSHIEGEKGADDDDQRNLMGRDKGGCMYLPRRLYDMIAVVYAHERRYTHKDFEVCVIWLAVTVAQKMVYG